MGWNRGWLQMPWKIARNVLATKQKPREQQHSHDSRGGKEEFSHRISEHSSSPLPHPPPPPAPASPPAHSSGDASSEVFVNQRLYTLRVEMMPACSSSADTPACEVVRLVFIRVRNSFNQSAVSLFCQYFDHQIKNALLLVTSSSFLKN